MCGYAVEWVRSCKYSYWRLTRDSTRLRRGVYYFSPPGTPHYPGLHNLGSREWTKNKGDLKEDPPLGEYSGPTQWYRGDPPATLPRAVLVGDADCIAHGERAGLPIVADAGIDCGRVFPPACYLAEESFADRTNVLDCVFGWQCARIVKTAYDDLEAAKALALEILGVGVATAFVEVADLFPAGVIIVAGDACFIWITGTTNFTQLGVQGIYFNLGPIDQGAYGASNLYQAAAFHLSDLINAAGAGACTRFVLCGHSYGAAAAYVLAAKMRLANPLRAVELLTFGMPKPGDFRLHDIVTPLRQKHYCNQNDPIPFVPPVPRNFVELLIVIALGLQVQWSLFARPDEITIIKLDGTLQAAGGGDEPDSLARALCQAAAFALEPPRFSDHSMAWYVYRLCVACKCVPRPCVEPPHTDVGFEVQIDDFEYTFQSVPSVVNVARVALTVITNTPSGKANAWASAPLGDERVVIEAVVDAFDQYVSFTLSYEPLAVSPLFLCVWHFTAAEMLAGVATIAFPDDFDALDVGDGVTTLGGLFVFPTLV